MTSRRLYRSLLLERAAHIVPGVYDALSARLAQRAGFRVVGAGGYAAIGSTLAQPDMGQSNMRDMAEHYGRICAAVDAPVTVDADTGFGGVHNVTQAVRSFEAAGVAGIMIGDQTFPNRCGYLPGKSVVPVEEMLAKIRAAAAARRDPDLVIIARTDARAVLGLDEALARCRLFLEAGADLAKPQTVDRPEAWISPNCGRWASLPSACRRSACLRPPRRLARCCRIWRPASPWRPSRTG
jgi:2-methylisocitrate lyase-like PEP mutase family enzyme